MSKTLVDVIREEAPEWDILAVDVTDRADDGTLFLIVIRRRVSENGDLILSERYFRFNPEAPEESTFLKNGIERRVTGALGPALRVLYAATGNGDTDPENPMLIDSRGDGLNYEPETLVDPLEPEEETPEFVDRRGVEEESVEEEPVERKGWVRCKRCGEALPKDDGILFSEGPPLGEMWIHDGGCPEEEEVDS